MTVKLSLRKIAKTFPPGREALAPMDLDVKDGEFLCLLGPSGCGKTTLLRIAAGLLEPSSGEILRRRSGAGLFACMVFQDLALFPWMTARENVEIAARFQGKPATERQSIASSYIRKARLAGCEDLYPHQLSLGMKQRVALARAFASNAEVLLMDEPLASLDASTRRILQEEVLDLWQQQRKTILFVTHSIEEALLLADRVAVLSAGPGRIRGVVEVPFPRPRPHGLREDARFAALSRDIWALLEQEVLASMQRK